VKAKDIHSLEMAYKYNKSQHRCQLRPKVYFKLITDVQLYNTRKTKLGNLYYRNIFEFG